MVEVSKPADAVNWRAWAAYHIGIIMGNNDPRVAPELWEAVTNGMFERQDDAEFQNALGAAIHGIVEVPIVVQKELPDGKPSSQGP